MKLEWPGGLALGAQFVFMVDPDWPGRPRPPETGSLPHGRED